MSQFEDVSAGERARIRETRELIVIDLATCYVVGIRESDLIRGMQKATMPRPTRTEHVLNDLAYLADPAINLIRSETRTMLDGSVYVRWFLTAKGKRFRELNMPWERVEQL